MPLTLQAVDMRLNATTPNLETEQSKGAGNKDKTTLALRETMKLLALQYNGVGLIEEVAEQVACTSEKMSAVSSLPAWPDLLARSPSHYLQILFVIDKCISKGKVAGEPDMRNLLECEVSEHSHNHHIVMQEDMPSSCAQEPQAPNRAAVTVEHQSFSSWQGCIKAPRQTDETSTMPFGLISMGSEAGYVSL
jgi:hypothetical protein